MNASLAERARELPAGDLGDWIEGLTDAEASQLLYDWDFWARPNQRVPGGAWTVWLIMAGRGYGKTRTGAETVREWARDYPNVNIVGGTADDVRNTMIEGESGILAICPDGERPLYEPSKLRLTWPNGGRTLILSADEPERARGKQHCKLWCDELASWRYAKGMWDMLMFGLRLGDRPQVVVTTTPRPIELVKDLVKRPTTHVTRGTSYENRSNLAAAFFADIVTRYEGTRLGRQELNAELLEDNPNSLWARGSIDSARVESAPALSRIVVAIDPSASSNEDSDETGIVAAGIDERYPAHFYILEDRSAIATPQQWAVASVTSYRALKADRIVGEKNNGGEMVESTIRNVDPNVSYEAVTATRGKAVRAEPIAALYEQGRVHHVGSFPKLEDQMCEWDPTMKDSKSPDRMDALVWALTELSNPSYVGLRQYTRRQAEIARTEKVA